MPPEPGSLEGWIPAIGPDCPLERVIDQAFDYRGNTTVVKTDGSRVTGYVFNRRADVADPFIQMFDDTGAGPLRIRYAEIRNIEFTGKDTAAGQSYAAWLARKEQEAQAAGGRSRD